MVSVTRSQNFNRNRVFGDSMLYLVVANEGVAGVLLIMNAPYRTPCMLRNIIKETVA